MSKENNEKLTAVLEQLKEQGESIEEFDAEDPLLSIQGDEGDLSEGDEGELP